MSTRPETARYVEDQLDPLPIRTGRMFGEYAVYLGDKVVAFICNDTLYIKPSSADPAVLEGTFPGQAYPGSKDYNTVPGELLDDREWLQAAILATAEALPAPAPKKPRKAQRPRKDQT